MIEEIKAKIISDSRKRATVQVELRTERGSFLASCPSGASTGKNEAKAVIPERAIKNIKKVLSKKLAGQDELDQTKIDKILAKNRRLGANAILPVSIAVCRAGAAAKNLPLYKYLRNRVSVSFPRPCFNIINGGAHAKNDLDIQEFMIVPNYKSFSENLRAGLEVFNKLKIILQKAFKGNLNMGDEGGFAPQISEPEKALDFIIRAVGDLKVDIGLDVAASQIKNKENYNLDFYKRLIKNYPIIFIEDPFAENDDKGFIEATKELGVTIVGDDYLTTNIKRIKRAKKKKACNGTIIKPNQIGTLTQTLQAVDLAKSYGWKVIVSHRSGETMDNFIADLAVGVGADFIKSGAPSRPERLAKYERLLAIEKEI